MNRTEHLLIKVAEECAEVAQRAAKALRFGLTEVQPGQDKNNAERLVGELEDLYAAVEVLEEEGSISLSDQGDLSAKRARIEKYLAYSAQLGTLSTPVLVDDDHQLAMFEATRESRARATREAMSVPSDDGGWNDATAANLERSKAAWEEQPLEVRKLIENAYDLGKFMAGIELEAERTKDPWVCDHLECAGCGVWSPGAEKPPQWTEDGARHYCYECSVKRQRPNEALSVDPREAEFKAKYDRIGVALVDTAPVAPRPNDAAVVDPDWKKLALALSARQDAAEIAGFKSAMHEVENALTFLNRADESDQARAWNSALSSIRIFVEKQLKAGG